MTQEVDFAKAVEQIVCQDPRFQPDAYEFVMQALHHTAKMLKREGHVSGQELLKGIRDYALKTYGPMAKVLLNEWGVTCCEDFGHIVFNLVNNNLLKKTQHDSVDDFGGGYDFTDAFEKPYRM